MGYIPPQPPPCFDFITPIFALLIHIIKDFLLMFEVIIRLSVFEILSTIRLKNLLIEQVILNLKKNLIQI